MDPISRFLGEDPIDSFLGDEAENVRHREGVRMRVAEARERVEPKVKENEWFTYYGRKSLPVFSSVAGYVESSLLKEAEERSASGEATQADYDVMAKRQIEDERQSKLTTLGKIGEGLAGIPAIVGEAALTGGGGTSRTVAGWVAGKAAQTAAMPSLYLTGTAERAREQGGSPLDPQNLGPAFAHGVLTNMVLGSVSNVASGVKNPVSRFLAKTGIGMAEMEAVNDTTTLLDQVLPEAARFRTDYGPLGTFLSGRHGEAGQKAVVDAVVFAAFTALHGNKGLSPQERGQRIAAGLVAEHGRMSEAAVQQHFQEQMKAYTAKLQEMSQRGIPATEAGKRLLYPYEVMRDLIRKNPNVTREEALAAMDGLKDKDAHEWGLAIAGTLPSGIPPVGTAAEGMAGDVKTLKAVRKATDADRLVRLIMAGGDPKDVLKNVQTDSPIAREVLGRVEASRRWRELQARQPQQPPQPQGEPYQTPFQAHVGMPAAFPEAPRTATAGETAIPSPQPEIAPQQRSSVEAAVAKSFPDARSTPRGEIEADVGGRKLYVGHDAERNVARIDFEAEKPGVPAEMQQGSLELMRGIRSLVRDLAEQGVGVEYRAVDTTRGAYKKGRADLYAKHLKEAGYEQVSEKEGVFLWRPKAEQAPVPPGTPEPSGTKPALEALRERQAAGEQVEASEIYEAAGLTSRERQVIEARLAGESLANIGRRQGVSRQAVEKLERKARAKLGMEKSFDKGIHEEERSERSIELAERGNLTSASELHADPEAMPKIRRKLTQRERELNDAADEYIGAMEEALDQGLSKDEANEVARRAIADKIKEHESGRAEQEVPGQPEPGAPEGVRRGSEARGPEAAGEEPPRTGEAAEGAEEIVLTDAQKQLQKRIQILPAEVKQMIRRLVLEERMSPEAVMGFADEIRAAETEGIKEHNALLKEAREWLGGAGKTIAFERVEEPGQIFGFDEMATALGGKYPNLLGSNPEQRLFDLLKQGNLKPPSMAEAVRMAAERIREGNRPAEEVYRPVQVEGESAETSFDDSFNFGANAEPPIERLEALVVQHSQDPYRTPEQLRGNVLEILRGMNQAELEATVNQFLRIAQTSEPIRPAAERLPPEKGGFTPEERAALDRMGIGEATPADDALLERWLGRANKIMEETRKFFGDESGALDIDALARKGRELLAMVREWRATPEGERGPSPLAEPRHTSGKRTIQLTPHQKRLLEMHDQGMSTAEIGKKVGLSRNAAGTAIYHARRKLAQQAEGVKTRDASALTPAQEQVLALRAAGLSFKAIADLKGIKQPTTIHRAEQLALAKLKETQSMAGAAQEARDRAKVAAMIERLDAGVQPASILDQLILQEEVANPSGEPTRIQTTRAEGRAERGRMSGQYDPETGERLSKATRSVRESEESVYNDYLDNIVKEAEALKAAGASQAEIDAIFSRGPSLEEYRAERRNRKPKAKGTRSAEEGRRGGQALEAETGSSGRTRQGDSETVQPARSGGILEAAQRLLADESGAVDFQRLYRTVRDYLNKRSAAPFGRPIAVDTAHPNPRLQPREVSKQIYATPRGAGRIPVLGRLLDPRAAADEIQVALITREGEVKFGESFAELTRHTLPTPPTLIAGQDGKIPLADGSRDFPSDVAEREYARPGSQPLFPEQRDWLRRQKVLLDDNVAMAAEEGVSKFVDENGTAIPLKEYSPRLAIGKQDLPPPTAGGSSRPGATPGSMKHRHYATEAEGYAAGVRYHPDLGVRLAKRLADGYKAVADHRLATDPVLQGEPFSRYKWLEKHRTASAPAFRMRIFPREIADRLDAWYGERLPQLGRNVDAANALQKGLQFTGDVSNFTVQLLPLMWRHPKQWWAAVTGGARALVDPAFQSKYLAVPENREAANALIQSGSSRGYVDYMMGLKPGEALTRIPIAGRAFEAFGRLFTASMDVAKIELWKKLAPSFNPAEFAELAEHIDNAVGVGRMETIGVRPVRSFAERLVFLAPTYYRSQANLIGEAFQRGATGRQTRQLIGAMALGTVASAAMAMKFIAGLDNEEISERMDPSQGKFLKVPVELADGSRLEVGFGGMLLSLVRLAGDLADSKDSDHPLNTGVHNNQILRWIRNHSSATVGLGLDLFMGEEDARTPGDVGRLAAKRAIPVSGQKVLSEGGSVQQKGADALFSFLGLNSYPESESNAYYRALDKEAGKVGKKYRDLSMMEMARAVRAVKREGITKPPATEAQRMRAVRAQQDRQKALARKLSQESREKLVEIGEQVPSYSRTYSLNGVEIPLTDAQAARYETILAEEYDRAIRRWNLPTLKKANAAARERFVGKSLESARARAKVRLRREFGQKS